MDVDHIVIHIILLHKFLPTLKLNDQIKINSNTEKQI